MKDLEGKITLDLRGCARCHEEHPGLEFKPLTRPVELAGQRPITHWATCPTNGEPIMMLVGTGE